MRNTLSDLSADDSALLKRHLRKPVLAFLTLIALIAVNVTLWATPPFAHVWTLKLVVAA